jgi:MoaA/NifB/PqqE/SkfB family radical SAM enzyme
MELYISDLILEVTRRCNMTCKHCMRGDAQDLDMRKEVIDRVLDAVEGHGIGTVTFTGGEPTLNVPIIQYFVDQVRERKVGVGSFFVVTNGKIESLSLVHALMDLYGHCDENDMSALVVSSDMYHEGVDPPRLYKALKFFREDGHGPASDEAVIREGRARKNGIGQRKYRQEELDIDSPMDDSEYVQINSSLHVAANGNVMPGCDFSYARADRERIGNVLKTPLKEIIAFELEKKRLVDGLKEIPVDTR